MALLAENDQGLLINCRVVTAGVQSVYCTSPQHVFAVYTLFILESSNPSVHKNS